MGWELYTSLVMQLSEMGVRWVYLFHCGEPMLHPHIDRMVGFARSHDIKIRLHTNGTQGITKCGLDKLIVSVNETRFVDTYKTLDTLMSAQIPFEFYDHRENEHNWRCAAGMSNHPRDKRCSQTYKTFVIGWDGKALACCADSDRLAVIGVATQESLQDIWNGEEMQAHRTAPQEWCNYCTMKDTVND